MQIVAAANKTSATTTSTTTTTTVESTTGAMPAGTATSSATATGIVTATATATYLTCVSQRVVTRGDPGLMSGVESTEGGRFEKDGMPCRR